MDAPPPAPSSKRATLRALNLAPPPPPPVQALDSSLKKNTAYIKRLKTGLHLADHVQALVKETRTVSLDKYLSEISTAAVEGLAKCKNANEVWGAVEVSSSRSPVRKTPADRALRFASNRSYLLSINVSRVLSPNLSFNSFLPV